ncbi:MAG: CoB--CoM heterodisulfide reductase iron-sulfur subunit B family protein [Desulfovibrionaceae bacterium]|nr:CoB--CoM heterodisulfide reductase iron-sulfur subunit B family protein [Desulfovibrionaceae bacterium]
MKFAYYPGCSGEGTSTEYEASTRAVCRALGLEFAEIEDWNCCGSTPAHAMDTVLSGALGARNLMLAGRAGAGGVVTPCPSCLSNLKMARHRMRAPEFKARVDELLDAPTPAREDGSADLPDTFSVLQVLLEEVGLEAIATRVTNSLEGLKVATYYGCLMSRPAEIMKFDDPENPTAMDKIMSALGAEVVPFPLKTECCGAAMGVALKEVTSSLSGRILASAKAFGADAVVTACPLCHMNLDLRQGQAGRATGIAFDMPVFYYTQLMALAFGLPAASLKLEKLAVSPGPVLKKLADCRAEKARVAAEAKQAQAESAARPAESHEAGGAAS